MPEHFHFLQPLWFLALLPLALLLWLIRHPGNADNPWRKVVDARLLPWLLTGSEGRNSYLPLALLASGWLVAVVALADPVWERQPQPVFRSQQSTVVVLDLSRSMLTPDLKPSRLVRARYKVADLLRGRREGQTGLVVFAGDAFTVSPLTSDTDTIQSLLSPLEPGLMPVQGSRVDLGLLKAGELLQQAGARTGNILLVADGFDSGRALKVAQALYEQGYTLSVLGAGTADGAPLPDGHGGYVRDSNNRIVMPKLDIPAMRQLAAAGGGHYITLQSSNSDIEQLLPDTDAGLETQTSRTELNADVWQSRGPWLVLLLLPLAALVFRRGWLLVAVFAASNGMFAPQPAMASSWDDLWLRRDQQAHRALQAGEPEQAQQLAEHPLRRGTAAYRAGEYQQAVQEFATAKGPEAEYDRGNALAKLGRYQEAIEAYDRALAERSDMADAIHNRAAVKKLLQQQNQQAKNDQQQSGQQDENQQQVDSDNRQEQEQSSGNSQQEQQQAQGSSQQKQEPQGKQQQSGSEGDQEQPQDSTEEQSEQPQNASGEQKTQDQESSQQAANESESENNDQQEQQAVQENQAQPASEQAVQENQAQPASEQAETGSQTDQTSASEAQARPLDTEEQLAAEQWLRRIPDDPGGLLRRKFLYQYRQRAAQADTNRQQTW